MIRKNKSLIFLTDNLMIPPTPDVQFSSIGMSHWIISSTWIDIITWISNTIIPLLVLTVPNLFWSDLIECSFIVVGTNLFYSRHTQPPPIWQANSPCFHCGPLFNNEMNKTSEQKKNHCADSKKNKNLPLINYPTNTAIGQTNWWQ